VRPSAAECSGAEWGRVGGGRGRGGERRKSEGGERGRVGFWAGIGGRRGGESVEMAGKEDGKEEKTKDMGPTIASQHAGKKNRPMLPHLGFEEDEESEQNVHPGELREGQLERAINRVLGDLTLDIGILPVNAVRLIANEALRGFGQCKGCQDATSLDIRHTFVSVRDKSLKISKDDENFLLTMTHNIMHQSRLLTAEWFAETRERIANMFALTEADLQHMAMAEVLQVIATGSGIAAYSRCVGRMVPEAPPQLPGPDMSKLKVFPKDFVKEYKPVSGWMQSSWSPMITEVTSISRATMGKLGGQEAAESIFRAALDPADCARTLCMSPLRAKSYIVWFKNFYSDETDLMDLAHVQPHRCLTRAQVEQTAAAYSMATNCALTTNYHNARQNVALLTSGWNGLGSKLQALAHAVATNPYNEEEIQEAALALAKAGTEHALLDAAGAIGAAQASSVLANSTGTSSKYQQLLLVVSPAIAVLAFIIAWVSYILGGPGRFIARLQSGAQFLREEKKRRSGAEHRQLIRDMYKQELVANGQAPPEQS